MQTDDDQRKQDMHFSFQKNPVEKLGDVLPKNSVLNQVCGDSQYHLMQKWQRKCRPLLEEIDTLTEKMPKFNEGNKEKEEQRVLKEKIDNLAAIVYHLADDNMGDFPLPWLKGAVDHIGKIALDYLGDSTYISLNKKMVGKPLSANEEGLASQAKSRIQTIILFKFTQTVSEEKERTMEEMGSEGFIKHLEQVKNKPGHTKAETDLLDSVIALARESRDILEGEKALSSFKTST